MVSLHAEVPYSKNGVGETADRLYPSSAACDCIRVCEAATQCEKDLFMHIVN